MSWPAAIVRRTWAPILVWCWTCQRNVSPTLRWTRSRSAASWAACVPLPLPCTPMITYLRTSAAWHPWARRESAARRRPIGLPRRRRRATAPLHEALALAAEGALDLPLRVALGKGLALVAFG